MAAITATTPPTMIPNVPLLSLFITVSQRSPRGPVPTGPVFEFGTIVAGFGPIQGKTAADSAMQICNKAVAVARIERWRNPGRNPGCRCAPSGLRSVVWWAGAFGGSREYETGRYGRSSQL